MKLFITSRAHTERKRGFTLVEILVVILIIGLLFVFLVPKIDTAQLKAREVGVKTDFMAYDLAFDAVSKEQGGLGKLALLKSSDKGSNPKAVGAQIVDIFNNYLDPALQLDTDVTGECLQVMAEDGHYLIRTQSITKLDPWNNHYTFYYSGLYAGHDDGKPDFHEGYSMNNGAVQIHSCGKDSSETTFTLVDRTGTQSIECYAGFALTPEQAGITPSTNHGNSDYIILDYVKDADDISNIMNKGNITPDDDDYTLTLLSVNGVNYTYTTGFSTNVKA